MAVSLEQASAYIENSYGDVASLLASAEVMITDYIGDAPVPEKIRDLAVMTLTQELAFRQRSPGGITQFGSEGVIGRVSRDPMSAVYPILKPWVGGFA